MSLHVYQNGVEIVSQAFIENMVIEESSDRGTISTWSLPIDDPAGTLNLTAHYPIQVVESASLYGTQVTYGFLTNRGVGRSDTSLTSNARAWNPTVVDLNAYLGFKVIRTQTFHHARPAETDLQRIHWLMLSSSAGVGVLPFLHDNGLIATTSGKNMSANDYAGQFPIDVLNDCAQTSGRNFFVYWDQTQGQASLFYNKASAAVYTSPITISNYPGQANNSTVFAPSGDAELRLDPAHLYSGVYMPYSGGSVYALTPDRQIARDVVAPAASVHSRAIAQARADRLLADYQNEEAILTFTVRVPNTHINAIAVGQRVAVRFSHLPAYASTTYARVVHRSIKPAAGTNLTSFDITYECNDPILVGIGSAPVGSTVSQPPFQQGTGGTPTYVQSAKAQNTDGTSPQVVTLGAAPTAGNFLGLYVGQVQSSALNLYTFPDGWDVHDTYIPPDPPAGAPADNTQMLLASKISDGTETSVSVSWTNTGPLELFYFEYSGTAGYGGFSHGQQAASATFTLPSVTPTASQPTAILAFLNWDPDYVVVSPLANTRQNQTRAGWVARAAMSYSDTIVSSATGSYNGITSGAVGAETGYAAIVTWLTGSAGDVPNIDQPVAPESATADGAKVIYQTTYPYQPGSLIVKVNGVIVVVAETDPTTGLFTLPAPPASGAIITWTYNVADPTPTGAVNGVPPPSGSSVPPSPGTVPGGDGIYRQPGLAYVPNEAPDGIRTVFTIVPYVAGTTIAYLNGLIQRPITDYGESSPGTGAVTFTSAPFATDNIVIVASPYLAAPTPTSTRSVTWPAPTTTATYTIPGTIDATGATDVVAAMNAWVASVPDGSILNFAGGTFKMSQGIQLSNRHNLVLNGNGATINVAAGAGGNNQLASPIVVGHAYGGSWTLGSTDIQIHDFTLVGNNPTPGVFTSGTEAQANLELTGCTRLEVYHITGSGAWGDFAFFEDVIDGWLHNCTGTNAGRNGISVISGTRVLAELSAFTTSGYNTFDIEPNNSSQACTNITIRNNTAATWGNAFLGIEGSHTGAPIHGAVISGNTITGKSLLTIVDNGNTSRMTNIAFTNNTSSAGSVAGPVLKFSHVDNVTVTGNTQVHTGALYSFTDCTNQVTT